MLSVVVPVFDEEANVHLFYKALAPVIDQLGMETEVIFVDDGSKDRTHEEITSIAREAPHVKSLQFSRNFGSHAAILAGLLAATGDVAVIISVDLQDPPELLPELVARWREGFHVVWAVREGREDPPLKKAFAAAFYKLFLRIALPDYPAKGMNFGLFDRQVLDKLRGVTELNHFLTGTIVWLGFRQTEVPYYRKARKVGESKWSMGKRIKCALDAIVSFSHFRIRFIFNTGIFISLLSFSYTSFLLVRKIAWGFGSPGWSSLMVAVLFLGGVTSRSRVAHLIS